MNCTPKVRQKKSNFWGAVQLWTVNNDDDMKKFFLSGVEGIITYKPEEAVKLRKSLQTKKE